MSYLRRPRSLQGDRIASPPQWKGVANHLGWFSEGSVKALNDDAASTASSHNTSSRSEVLVSQRMAATYTPHLEKVPPFVEQ